ncbi:acyl-CoA dehydrogenase family protein [Kallotenue papyrolyticum]|uniref:acyl-CoA dehydrogenase family protein n=1 Tax=Kallotenue papyrolyticum TaxID=1325125 RepID=UPI00047863F8|nr:acyl-CoA dehydrogenase family protein [Kallotenue papyrolyticum]
MHLFQQAAPELGNQYHEDRVLRAYLQRHLPPDLLRAWEPALTAMGALAGGELYRLQQADRLNEPRLTQWDAWGARIDHIELTPLWRVAERLAAEYGLVATAYDQSLGPWARPLQFALAYLFHPSTDIYTCPLAMTDGAARTLLQSGNQALIERAVPHLLSRDPAQFWTSGQWMTELTGGSDVGRAESVARQDADGTWRLYGRKWFTSAATSQMALTLARPEGNPPGVRGLALFYVETRDAQGRLRNIEVLRLKDKLGTRKLPTAELLLNGTPAQPVAGLRDGVRQIVPMLHLTRTWNSVMSAATMRRGLALARDYARKRVAFDAPLARQPLHVDTLAGLQAEFEAAFHLSFWLAELIGRDEHGQLAEQERYLLRLLTSIIKLTTARQAVAAASETLESFGGAGYIEDTGLPVLLRDSQVLPIWEGTTNVLALDLVHALLQRNELPLLGAAIRERVAAARDRGLQAAGRQALAAYEHAAAWFAAAQEAGRPAVEAGARRFALTLGRALALALLIDQAQWSLDRQQDGRARAAALRFAQLGVDQIAAEDTALSQALADDAPLPTPTADPA